MSKKLSKSLLKEIVKECLVELLFEGIGDDENLVETANSTSKNRSLLEAVESRQKEDNQSRQSKFSSSRKSTPQMANQSNARVEASISGLTNDPIMAEIFADTARTTLVEQAQSEGRGAPATAEAAAVANTDHIEDLFSGAGNWADIAFAGQNIPKT